MEGYWTDTIASILADQSPRKGGWGKPIRTDLAAARMWRALLESARPNLPQPVPPFSFRLDDDFGELAFSGNTITLKPLRGADINWPVGKTVEGPKLVSGVTYQISFEVNPDRIRVVAVPTPDLNESLREHQQRQLARDQQLRDDIHSLEDLKVYQDKVRENFRRLLGPWPDRTPLEAKVTGVLQRDGYRIEKILMQSQPGFYVPINLYVPTGRKEPMPVVLSPLGHAADGKAHSKQGSYQALFESTLLIGNDGLHTESWFLDMNAPFGPGTAQLLSCIAPRPMLILGNQNDDEFPPKSMAAVYDNTKKLYEQIGVSERLEYASVPTPHGFWPEARRELVRFLNQQFGKEDEGTHELPLQPEPKAHLFCAPDGQVSNLPGAKTVYTLNGAYMAAKGLNSRGFRVLHMHTSKTKDRIAIMSGKPRCGRWTKLLTRGADYLTKQANADSNQQSSRMVAVGIGPAAALSAQFAGLVEPEAFVGIAALRGLDRMESLAEGIAENHSLQMLPGALQWFDEADLAAAIAPKPLLLAQVKDKHGQNLSKDQMHQRYQWAQSHYVQMQRALALRLVPSEYTPDQLAEWLVTVLRD